MLHFIEICFLNSINIKIARTFSKSRGWVQQAAIALAIPPKYHLPTLLVLSVIMIYVFFVLDLFITFAIYILFAHIYTYHIIFAITFQGWTKFCVIGTPRMTTGCARHPRSSDWSISVNFLSPIDKELQRGSFQNMPFWIVPVCDSQSQYDIILQI